MKKRFFIIIYIYIELDLDAGADALEFLEDARRVPLPWERHHTSLSLSPSCLYLFLSL